jgi:PHD/YefM family antitoxin component YafN of YafNO toxin-antitoxin module
MATLVLERRVLPEAVRSFIKFTSERVLLSDDGDGCVVLSPVIDPDDYDNETDYINAVPGMAEKILAAAASPRSEDVDVEEIWPERTLTF